MRKSNLFKIFVVMGLSLILVANLFNVVFADDDDLDLWDSPNEVEVTTPSNSTTDNTNNTQSNSSSINEENNVPLNTEGITTSLDNTNEKDENENNSNVNSLVYAGVEDTSVLFVVILIGAVVAGYSFKKVRDYNNI